MKRMNVIVDEKLLEQVRQSTGERTYSGTIQKALEELVRKQRLQESLDAIWNMGDDAFWPGYLEERGYKKRSAKEKIAANERRLPRKKVARRGSR